MCCIFPEDKNYSNPVLTNKWHCAVTFRSKLKQLISENQIPLLSIFKGKRSSIFKVPHVLMLVRYSAGSGALRAVHSCFQGYSCTYIYLIKRRTEKMGERKERSHGSNCSRFKSSSVTFPKTIPHWTWLGWICPKVELQNLICIPDLFAWKGASETLLLSRIDTHPSTTLLHPFYKLACFLMHLCICTSPLFWNAYPSLSAFPWPISSLRTFSHPAYPV